MGNSKKINVEGRSEDRVTGANILDKNPKIDIYLDKDYFKLKNQQRRDAALQHEEGHIRYQSNDNNVDYNQRVKALKDIDLSDETLCKEYENDYMQFIYDFASLYNESPDFIIDILNEKLPDHQCGIFEQY